MLTDNPLSSGDDSYVGSRVISCFTILDTRLAHLVSHDEDSFESKFYILSYCLDFQFNRVFFLLVLK